MFNFLYEVLFSCLWSQSHLRISTAFSHDCSHSRLQGLNGIEWNSRIEFLFSFPWQSFFQHWSFLHWLKCCFKNLLKKISWANFYWNSQMSTSFHDGSRCTSTEYMKCRIHNPKQTASRRAFSAKIRGFPLSDQSNRSRTIPALLLNDKFLIHKNR